MFKSIFDAATGPSSVTLFWSMALVAGLISTALVVGVIVLRLYLKRKQTTHDDVIARWRPFFLRAIGSELRPGELSALRKLSRDELPGFLSLWNLYQESLRGGARVALNHVAASVRMREAARDMIVKGSPEDKLIGMVTLCHLAREEDWPLIHAALGDTDPHLSLAAAQALLRLDVTTALPLALDKFLARHDWSVPRLATLLSHLNQDDVAHALGDRLMLVPPVQQVRIMPLLRVTRSPEVQRILSQLLATSDDAAVLAATLAQVNDRASDVRVVELAHHADEQVRAYAALSLGRSLQIERDQPESKADIDEILDAVAEASPTSGAWQLNPDSDRRAQALDPPTRRHPPPNDQARPRRRSIRRRRVLEHPIDAQRLALARTGLDLLMGLLGDKAWVVRRHAAQSLVQAPNVNEDHIDTWLDQVGDRFGQDAINQAWADVRFAQIQTEGYEHDKIVDDATKALAEESAFAELDLLAS